MNTTGTPTRISDSCSAGTDASSLMLDGSTTVNSAVPGCTISPGDTGRSLTMPPNGEVTVVLRNCLSAVASLEFASSSAACAAMAARRDSSMSRSAIAPAASNFSFLA